MCNWWWILRAGRSDPLGSAAGNGRQFDGIAWGEGLAGNPRILNAIDPVTAVRVPVHVVSVKDDIAIKGSAQGVRLDAPRRAMIAEFDA